MKLGTLLIISVAILRMATADAATYREDELKLVQQETQALRSCTPMSSCPVFFISLFGGKFPLPTRYQLVSTPGSISYTFTSSPHESSSSNQVSAYLGGFITVGKVENLRASESSGKLRLVLVRKVGALGLYKVETRPCPVYRRAMTARTFSY